MKRSWGTECAPAWRAWLDRATEQIFRHPDCGAVERELLDHLEDKATDLMRIFPGLTREEAEQRALEEMGAAEELGEELARVHSPLVGELWQLTRFLIRAVLVVLAVVFVKEYRKNRKSARGQEAKELPAQEKDDTDDPEGLF